MRFFFPEARVDFYLILSTYCVNLMIVLNNTQHETYSEQTVACVMPYWPLAAQCSGTFHLAWWKLRTLWKVRSRVTLPKPSFCSHQPPFCSLSLSDFPSYFILVDSRSVCLFETGLCHSASCPRGYSKLCGASGGFLFMAE